MRFFFEKSQSVNEFSSALKGVLVNVNNNAYNLTILLLIIIHYRISTWRIDFSNKWPSNYINIIKTT